MIGLGSLIETELKIPTSVTKGPSGATVKSFRTGEAELVTSSAAPAHWAYSGTGLYAKEEPLKSMRMLGAIPPTPQHIVTRADTGIRSVPDWRGKKIMFLT